MYSVPKMNEKPRGSDEWHEWQVSVTGKDGDECLTGEYVELHERGRFQGKRVRHITQTMGYGLVVGIEVMQ